MDEGIDQQAESLFFLTLLLFILLRNEAHAYFEELFANPADVLWIKKRTWIVDRIWFLGQLEQPFPSAN